MLEMSCRFQGRRLVACAPFMIGLEVQQLFAGPLLMALSYCKNKCIVLRCSPRLGGELLCAPNQLRHYLPPDDLS